MVYECFIERCKWLYMCVCVCVCVFAGIWEWCAWCVCVWRPAHSDLTQQDCSVLQLCLDTGECECSDIRAGTIGMAGTAMAILVLEGVFNSKHIRVHSYFSFLSFHILCWTLWRKSSGVIWMLGLYGHCLATVFMESTCIIILWKEIL